MPAQTIHVVGPKSNFASQVVVLSSGFRQNQSRDFRESGVESCVFPITSDGRLYSSLYYHSKGKR